MITTEIKITVIAMKKQNKHDYHRNQNNHDYHEKVK